MGKKTPDMAASEKEEKKEKKAKKEKKEDEKEGKKDKKEKKEKEKEKEGKKEKEAKKEGKKAKEGKVEKTKRSDDAPPAAPPAKKQKQDPVPTAPAAPRKAAATWRDLEEWGMQDATNLATRRVLAVIKKHEEFGRDRRTLDDVYDPDQYKVEPTKEDLFSDRGLLPITHAPLVKDVRGTYSRACGAQYWQIAQVHPTSSMRKAGALENLDLILAEQQAQEASEVREA